MGRVSPGLLFAGFLIVVLVFSGLMLILFVTLSLSSTKKACTTPDTQVALGEFIPTAYAQRGDSPSKDMGGDKKPKDSSSTDTSNSGGTSAPVETVDSLNGYKIPYPDTKLGREEHLTETYPTHYEGPDSNPLTFAGAGAYAPHTTEQERWYFNEYWPTGGDGWEVVIHKKLLVASVETGKSVVVSVEEAGPHPSVTARDGIGAGAPPEVKNALGITTEPYDGNPKSKNGRIKVAFVKDQNTPLGPAGGGLATTECADGTGGTQGPPNVIKKNSFPAARRTINPTALVLHYTAVADASVETTVRALKGNNSCGADGCSVQLTIDGQGRVYQLTPFINSLAEHAAGINDKAIGIEIGGADEEQLLKNEEQFQAVVATVIWILNKYNMPVDGDAEKEVGLVSHADVGKANGYGKPDPGETYMQKVRDAVRNQVGK